jgi:hypothetical protein
LILTFGYFASTPATAFSQRAFVTLGLVKVRKSRATLSTVAAVVSTGATVVSTGAAVESGAVAVESVAATVSTDSAVVSALLLAEGVDDEHAAKAATATPVAMRLKMRNREAMCLVVETINDPIFCCEVSK